jgi:hypothetical protein
VQDALWNRGEGTLWIVGFGLGATLLWLFSLRRGPPRSPEVVAGALIAVGLLLIELVWSSSATETPRTLLPAGAALIIGFLLLAAFAADRLLHNTLGNSAQSFPREPPATP